MTGGRGGVRPSMMGDSGSALVGAQIILVSLMVGPLMWLVGDIGRSVSYRTAAREVAFEAARAGARQVGSEGTEGGSEQPATIDREAASLAVHRSARESLSGLGLEGRVAELEIGVDWVIVGIEILDGERGASGRAGVPVVSR
jgi:hypothetical protein